MKKWRYWDGGNLPVIYKILLIFVFALSCSREFAVTKASMGQGLSPAGDITNESLVFRFRTKETFAKNKDFFNFIYFEGDTLCFSFKFSKPIEKESLAVFFINPSSGEKYTAERIDIIAAKRVAGFSLTGSLLEQFFKNKINAPFSGRFTAGIPFIIRIEAAYNGQRVSHEMRGEFKIELETPED
jgi:hypothetical protein